MFMFAILNKHPMKIFPKSLFLFILLFALYFWSCKKAEVDTDTQAAEDNSIAEQSFGQVGPTVVSVGIKEEGVKKTNIPVIGLSTEGNLFCATVKVTDVNGKLIDSTNFTSFPKKVEIDFGTGCPDIDGRIRKGKIRAEFTNRWTIPGASVTINFVNYYVDDVNYQGIIKMTNNGNYSYSTIVDGGKVTSASPAFTIEYECNQTTKWISGYNTDSIASDDVYEITGNANGVNRKGQTYATVIIQSLVKDMSCKWIVKGQVDLTPEKKNTRSINFGDGTCDNKAAISVNGNVKEVSLP